MNHLVGARELNIKRMYLPGVFIKVACPECGADTEWDGDIQYMSYPVPNTDETVGLYCDACGHDWDVTVRLNLSVEVLDA
jgi:hypothetical protein